MVDRLPNNTKMNNAYFVTNLPIPIEHAIFARGTIPYETRLVVRRDNCSVHTSWVSTNWFEKNSILFMPHPPYSADLAPSDFYLFSTVSEKLEQFQLADEDKFWYF
jgi:hypothetical protein